MDKKTIKKLLKEGTGTTIEDVKHLLETSTVGFITAYRYDNKDCCSEEYLNKFPNGDETSIKQFCQQKQEELKNDLGRYEILSTIGGWLDKKQVWVVEPTFVVIDKSNSEDFESVIKNLGRKYCQDTVIVSIPGESSLGNINANINMYNTKSCGEATLDTEYKNLKIGKNNFGYTILNGLEFHFGI